MSRKKIRLYPSPAGEEIGEIAAATLQAGTGAKAPPREKAKAHSREPQAGDEMPDGTIYAGISPDTQKPMYAFPADAPLSMDFKEAAGYAKKLKIGDKQDFRVPSQKEIMILFRNREKGALKGTFNATDTDAGCYWSSATLGENVGVLQRFDNGRFEEFNGTWRLSVRCVR